MRAGALTKREEPKEDNPRERKRTPSAPDATSPLDLQLRGSTPDACGLFHLLPRPFLISTPTLRDFPTTPHFLLGIPVKNPVAACNLAPARARKQFIPTFLLSSYNLDTAEPILRPRRTGKYSVTPLRASLSL
jgi:hypothetical protein